MAKQAGDTTYSGPKQDDMGGMTAVEASRGARSADTPGDSPTDGMAASAPDPKTKASADLNNWLINKARTIYTSSTNYLDTNITNQWERNLSHFRNEHAPGSAFLGKNFKRSRVFRPKTRSSVKGQEAALATAAFSSEQLVLVTAEDPLNEVQRVSAQIARALLQYRLTKTIPWFLTVQGAYQNTKVYGLCISHNYWRYETTKEMEAALDDDDEPVKDADGNAMGREKVTVLVDKPCVDLIAPENFRFDAMADWRDPINTSPYLIYEMPMYVGEVLERMERVDDKTGQPVWKKYSKAEILSTRRKTYDRTRQAREGNERVDPTDNQPFDDFMTVWAHMNVVREDGVDIVYWTLGTELVLTDPEPLTKLYPHLPRGTRPFTMGVAIVEAHRNYPDGDVAQAAGLQEEINKIANQRLDNVRLVLNKRYFVRRGAQVDLEALIRNTPGGGVMMNDPDKDAKVIDTPDVTASSYQEQDRLAVEMDELVGSFSQGSVQSNKSLNDTVGGMSMLSQNANGVNDYSIRVFTLTWMEPTLRQLMLLEQYYETDQVLLGIATKQSDAWQKYGIDQATDELLRQELTLNVDIGMGNTDPVRRVERLVFGVSNVVGLPDMAKRIKSTDIADEIFASLGYKASSRFFRDDQEQAEYEKKNPPQPAPEIALKQQELKDKKDEADQRHQRETTKIQNEHDLGQGNLDTQIKVAEINARQKTDSSGVQSKTTRDVAAAAENNRMLDITLKHGKGAEPKPQQPGKPSAPSPIRSAS
jgi:hypothetical protein